MYKVFINDLAVEFILTNTFSQGIENEIIESVLAADISSEYIERLVAHYGKELKVVTDNVELAWENFCKSYAYVPAAGGVVFTPEKEILVIFRNGKWDLPKGKIEEGEEITEAALREVAEECGVKSHRIGRELKSTWHTYDTYGPKCLKRTYWFVMQIDNKEDVVPQAEEGIESVEWLHVSKLNKVLSNTYNSIQSVLEEVIVS